MDITKNEMQMEMYSVNSQLPENKKTPVKAPWWHIDREMVRFKVHFFLFGGLAPSIPFLAMFAIDGIGLSISSWSSILRTGRYLLIFTKPLVGFLTDYFNKLKATITILTGLSVILLFSLLLIPRIIDLQAEESIGNNEKIKQKFDQFKTYQFWLFAVILTVAMGSADALLTLSDTACCETIAKTGADFGRQRLYGAVGWFAILLIEGLLIYLKDYVLLPYTDVLIWIIMGLYSVLCLWNLWKMDLVQPQFSQNIMKDVGKVFCNAEFLAFELGVLFNGIGCGFWLHQIGFLYNIGGSTLLYGLVRTVQCFLGEIPFMFFSGWFIRKVGHFNILSLSLAAYCIRFFSYSYLQDPWKILPMEVAHGFTFGLFYAAVASYAKLSAKPGTEATTQSILSSTLDTLGPEIGVVIAGLGFSSIGDHQTFFYASIFSGCGLVVNVALTVLNSRQQESIDVTISQ